MSNQRSRVFITGASRGIGKAAALEFARRGSDVVLAARSAPDLERVAEEVARLGVSADVAPLDVTDDASVRDGVARALKSGPIDLLVNNAGIFHQRTFLRQTSNERRLEMEVNYFGAQRVTEALLPSMIERRRGTIVNVSSLLGAIPCPTGANYSGTKAALNAWSHALRGEVSRHGVRIVVFMPSHTATEMTSHTRFDGVPALPVDYTAKQLVHAAERAPRSFAASPVFRMFLRLASLFPAWAEGKMRESTESLLLEA